MRPRNEDRSTATPLPKPPGNLHPLSRELLESLELLQCTQKQFSVMSMADCWRAFTDKDLGIGIDEAKRKIIARLAMIEASRPLETIQPVEAREQAWRVREWYYRVFAVPTP